MVDIIIQVLKRDNGWDLEAHGLRKYLWYTTGMIGTRQISWSIYSKFVNIKVEEKAMAKDERIDGIVFCEFVWMTKPSVLLHTCSASANRESSFWHCLLPESMETLHFVCSQFWDVQAPPQKESSPQLKIARAYKTLPAVSHSGQ